MTKNTQPQSQELTKISLKEMLRKILMLSILLAIVINILVTNFGGERFSPQADAQFEPADAPYLGDVGMAISLNIGLHDQSTKKIPVELSEEIIPLADLLANPDLARSRLISRHMMSVQEYVNILRTNIPQLLNSASDRSATLESFIDQLQYRYKTTAQNTTILRSQIRQLDATVSQAQTQVNTIKEEMQKAYAKMDTERVEELISVYLKAKQDTVYAQTYSLFLKRSLNQYIALNDYNKVLLDTLINNKEALIKNATVVLPDSGTGLLKKLNLLRTESEHKAVEN